MTRDEAIEHIQQFWNQCDSWNIPDEEGKEACEMAIEVLSAQNERMADEEVAEFNKQLAYAQPCEDAVRRIDVMEACRKYSIGMDEYDKKGLMQWFEDLPSVQLESKHSKWIKHEWAEEVEGTLVDNYECEKCHGWVRNNTDFCPNCGSDMRGGKNE